MVDIQEKVAKGHIHFKAIIEMAGQPKEYIEETLKKYVEKIKEHQDYTVISSDFVPAKELEEQKGMFLAFVDMELLAKDPRALTGFCFDYMPGSIEILSPEELKISAAYMSNIVNDLQAKLHKLDMGIKKAVNENQFVQKNIHLLLRNLVMIVIGQKGRNLQEISTLSGMEPKDMEIFLNGLIKKDLLVKEGELYKRKNEQ